VVAERLAKTLMRPLFSATKTRPSGEKRTAVGNVNPEKTTDSENPAGKVAAWTVVVSEPRRQAVAVQTMSNEEVNLLLIRVF
jgi:ribosomal protein S7